MQGEGRTFETIRSETYASHAVSVLLCVCEIWAGHTQGAVHAIMPTITNQQR